MDRISALRNVEDALRGFEKGDADLTTMERRVAATLRTYATEFEGDDDVFRAVGDEPAHGTVVVAPTEPAARERVQAAVGVTGAEADAGDKDADDGDAGDHHPRFKVERI
ncbi:hypothetical protein JCM17823_16560 [Halorubrum gandharaense]